MNLTAIKSALADLPVGQAYGTAFHGHSYQVRAVSRNGRRWFHLFLIDHRGRPSLRRRYKTPGGAARFLCSKYEAVVDRANGVAR